MFGISFTELIIIFIFAVILINPKEYMTIYRFINGLAQNLKSIYDKSVIELKSLKSAANITEINNELEEDIEVAEEEIQKIIGDDGNVYDSYDISDMMIDKNATIKHRRNKE